MTIIETATAPQAQQRTSALLDVKDLRVTFKTPDGDVTAVNDLNFDLRAGIARLPAMEEMLTMAG